MMTDLPRVIGFAGLIGAGKTTCACHLEERHGYVRVRFAGALKEMMRALGLSDREIDGDLKEVSCDLLGGKTPRFGMQTLGTEWGREIIHPDIWINSWRRRASAEIAQGRRVVADDVRFLNEVMAVHSLAGVTVRVVRASEAERGAHVSELQDFATDYTLLNLGGVDDVPETVDRLLARIAAEDAA